jgi:hypothetical protein
MHIDAPPERYAAPDDGGTSVIPVNAHNPPASTFLA